MYNHTYIVCTIVHAFCTHAEIGNSQPCLLPPLRNFASLTWPPLFFSVVIMTNIQTKENTYTHQHKNIKVSAQKNIEPAVSWLPVRIINLFKDTLHQEKPDPLKLIWNNEPLQWWQAAPERFLSQMSIFLLTTLHSVSCLEFRTAPLNVKVWNNIFGRFDQNWLSVSTLSQWMEMIGNLWRFF